MADNADVNPNPELTELDPSPQAVGTTARTNTEAPAPEIPNPREQAKATLKEAFPTIDDSIIEAVLIASGGNLEPAFHALLGV